MGRVVVTGAAGFIGSHLAAELLDAGHEVWAFDAVSTDRPWRRLPQSYEGLHRHQAEFGNGDWLVYPNNWVRHCPNEPDVVYHLAADATEGRAQFTPSRCTVNGLSAAMEVFSLAIQRRAKRIVFTSSAAVYGSAPTPFNEGMRPVPADIYGINKLAAEDSLQLLAKLHGVEAVVVRPHNVYGPWQEMGDPYRNVVAIFINRLMREQPVMIYGDGCQVRQWTYISDVVWGLRMAGFSPNATRCPVYNLGTNAVHTVKDLALCILRKMGMSAMASELIRFVDARPCEVQEVACSNSVWEKVFGPAGYTPLEEGVQKTVEWCRAMGPVEPTYLENLEITSGAEVPETWTRRLI